MCGIFGIVTPDPGHYPGRTIRHHVEALFTLSESRGKEASGIAVKQNGSIHVLKEPISASSMIRSVPFKTIIDLLLKNASDPDLQSNPSLSLIGHSRLVTNGSQELNSNNQPVIKEGVIMVHNGIVVNEHALWRQYPEIQRLYEVDTEIIASLLHTTMKQTGSLEEATQTVFADIYGETSIAVLFTDQDKLLIATNTGSLYGCMTTSQDLFMFASERFILAQAMKEHTIRNIWKGVPIFHISAGSGCIVDTNQLVISTFHLPGSKGSLEPIRTTNPAQIIDHSHYGRPTANLSPKPRLTKAAGAVKSVQERHLHRCSRCILPETFPYISFDEQGICNYCRSYTPVRYLGTDALETIVAPHRKNSGEPDCLVAFSGGRDSSYMLHYVKTVLNMNPIAFTYDWGMVTDLARRNQSRICGQLGVEHIVISADIEKKRRYIHNNLEAWLKKPDLGMVPILMAGDKQFYYFAHTLMKQTGVDLIFSGGNPFEKTDFKLGFCGIHEDDTRSRGLLTGISLMNKLKLFTYYGRQYLKNPGYINDSLFDTIHAFYSSYILPDAYVYFYHYVPWDEEKIMAVLRTEYDWEYAGDTSATWRIGDGTAAFYNYIYATIAGFSEFDTFRSNQVREGLMTRGAALKLVHEENAPRYEALRWYADTVGFDLNDALETIGNVPQLSGKGTER
jgi:glutamine---fructose-6-phosphate transaminase (isomerizing)